MWGNWYLPKFLLSKGSFTWLYIGSLMFLVILCGSLSTMVKHSALTLSPVMLLWWWMGDGALRCSLSLSQKVLLDSHIYSSWQFICGHLNLYITLLFCNLLSLALGAMRRFFIMLVPWSVPVSPCCCMSFWTSPLVPVCKLPLWKCSCCYCCCCLFHCCCWVGCQWNFVQCGCYVCN